MGLYLMVVTGGSKMQTKLNVCFLYSRVATINHGCTALMACLNHSMYGGPTFATFIDKLQLYYSYDSNKIQTIIQPGVKKSWHTCNNG
jgi:hypothetical protein